MKMSELIKEFPKTMPNDWHKHSNGGGWVYKHAMVERTSFVGPEAVIGDKARVIGMSRVFDNARVLEKAFISNAKIHGNAKVFMRSIVSDGADISGNVWVFGARVESVKMSGEQKVGYGNYLHDQKEADDWKRTKVDSNVTIPSGIKI